MKIFNRCFIAVCIFGFLLAVLPSASADDWNRKTLITFSAPFEVPGVGAQVLPAGSYIFKMIDSGSSQDRHIVQILNQDETHIFATILAIPDYRLESTEKTVVTFQERAEGQPQAIRAWFYPGRKYGDAFVYPKAKAIELAKISNEPVLYTPIEAANVDELKSAPVEAIKPTGEVVPLAEVVKPPVEVAKVELPKTASYLPLLAIFGLLALSAACLITKFSA